jgi:hypothetical protein
MIALLLAAAILAGAQGPARVPQREAHVTAMRALARAAIERDPESNRAGQEALKRAMQASGDERRSARLLSRIGDRLRTVICCAVLQAGAFAGVPMRPEQIRDLMQSLNQPKIAQTTPEEDASARRV